MKFKELSKTTINEAYDIAKSLPEWFTADGLEYLQKDLLYQKGYVLSEGNQTVGFISFFVNQGKATIGWLGVRKEKQRNGIGVQLLKKIENDLKISNISEIYVSTLGDSVDYLPYNQTRGFYRKAGFVDFEKINHPDNPECEEELLLKKVI